MFTFATFLRARGEEYVVFAADEYAAVVVTAVFFPFALVVTVFFPFGVTQEGSACDVETNPVSFLVLVVLAEADVVARGLTVLARPLLLPEAYFEDEERLPPPPAPGFFFK